MDVSHVLVAFLSVVLSVLLSYWIRRLSNRWDEKLTSMETRVMCQALSPHEAHRLVRQKLTREAIEAHRLVRQVPEYEVPEYDNDDLSREAIETGHLLRSEELRRAPFSSLSVADGVAGTELSTEVGE